MLSRLGLIDSHVRFELTYSMTCKKVYLFILTNG